VLLKTDDERLRLLEQSASPVSGRTRSRLCSRRVAGSPRRMKAFAEARASGGGHGKVVPDPRGDGYGGRINDVVAEPLVDANPY
jgi:hypothetical protein